MRYKMVLLSRKRVRAEQVFTRIAKMYVIFVQKCLK